MIVPARRPAAGVRSRGNVDARRAEAEPRAYAAVVMGCSAGGFPALEAILGSLPADFRLPIVLVQHLHASDAGLFAGRLAQLLRLTVVEAGDKQTIAPAHVHVAPANYHLLVEDETTLALSVDSPVNYSRPAIDVLFESAARAFGAGLVAVLLSGSSSDGVAGLRAVRAAGGRNLVQDPASAVVPLMPSLALEAGVADEILSPPQIAIRLKELCSGGRP